MNAHYVARLKGCDELGPGFRTIDVTADTDMVMVVLPPGEEPVPYLARAGQDGSEGPITEFPYPIAFFKREGEFQLHKGKLRASFRFFERREPAYLAIPKARVAEVIMVIRCGLIHIADGEIAGDTENALLAWCEREEQASSGT
jgi:hypothetical protein